MENDLHQNIFVITGGVQSGKTTFLRRMVKTIISEGYKVSGFLSIGSFEEGVRSGFTLNDIGSGISYPLASIYPEDGWLQFRKFYFDPGTLKRGIHILTGNQQEDPDLLVIDEVGPMELEGRGWNEAIEKLAGNYNLTQLWVVRENALQAVMKRWKISLSNVVGINQHDKSAGNQLIGKLKNHMNN